MFQSPANRLVTLVFFWLSVCGSVPAIHGQEITVDEYLKTPTLINARRLARQGKAVIPDLVSKVTPKDDAVSVASMRAICCSLEQTETSRALMEELADGSDVAPSIRRYAEIGDWLNHPTDFSRLKKSANSSSILIEIGDRGFFAIAEAMRSATAADAGPLSDILSRIKTQQRILGISEIARTEIDRWFQIALKSESYRLFDVVDSLFDLCDGDQEERSWIDRLLKLDVKLEPLSDLPQSNRLQLLFICLRHLESREVDRKTYESLIAVFTSPEIENGSDAESAGQTRDRRSALLGVLHERGRLMKSQSGLGNARGIPRSPNASEPAFVNQWIVDTAAKLLCSDIPTVQAITQQQLIQVSDSDWIEAENAIQSVIDELVEFNSETSLVAAAGLLAHQSLTPENRDLLIQWTRQKGGAQTNAVAFEAALTLAKQAGNFENSTWQVYQHLAIEISSESSPELNVRRLKRLIGEDVSICIDAVAKTLHSPVDVDLKIELVNEITQAIKEQRSQSPELVPDLTGLSEAILANLGQSELFDVRCESILAEHYHQSESGLAKYRTFYEESENEDAKQMIGYLLVHAIKDEMNDSIGKLSALSKRHPDLIASSRSDFSGIALSAGRFATAYHSKERSDENSRAVALDRLLSGQHAVVSQLAELAHTEGSAGSYSARLTLQHWSEVLKQALNGKLK